MALAPFLSCFMGLDKKSAIFVCLFWLAVLTVLIGIWFWVTWSVHPYVHP